MALRWVLAGAVVFGCSFAAREARALEREPAVQRAAQRAVLVDSTACPAVSASELRELVALELSPRPVLSQAGSVPDDLTRAQVSCVDSHAHLSVEDPSQQRRQELDLDLDETIVSARTRLVALALSELVATLDMETPTPQATAEKPGQPPHAAPVSWRGRWWLGIGLAREGRPHLLAPALHSGMLWHFGRLPLALQAQLLASRGRRASNDGDVVAWTAAGSMALALRIAAAAWLDLTCAAGVALGYARLVGSPHADSAVSGHSVSGVFWGPLLSIGALVPLRTRWGLRAGVDLTYVAKPVRGFNSAGQATYALERLQLHATLSVTVGF